MARRDVKLIGSLVNYIQDIKPYHTKLREFASEIVFKDTCNVSILDDHHLQIFMQNTWTRDDIGCQSMSTIAEGNETDRYFRIPAAIWPHFSINDNFPIQTPHGTDPVATVDELLDIDSDGLPDYEDPWIRDRTTSHFPGSDWVPVPAIISDWDIHLAGPVTVNGLTYNFTYDLELSVDSSIEDLYGLGNYYQAFVDGQDVTYKTSRNSTVGSYDSGQYEDNTYDSQVRSFTISGLSGSFTLRPQDFSLIPGGSAIIGDYVTGGDYWVSDFYVDGDYFPADYWDDLIPDDYADMGGSYISIQLNSWVAQFALALHRPRVELFYTRTGRYKVPFHQGSRVYVDGNLAVFGSTYIVESSRNFIQFLPGKHPEQKQTISVNTMTVDRLFISKTAPFDVNPQQNINQNWIPFTGAGYDEVVLEDLPFDMGLPNIVTDYFTFKIDDSYPGRISPVSFMNSTTTEGKATLTIKSISPEAMNGEIYLICATGLWTYSVQQIAPYRSEISHGSFKQTFNNGKVSFIVDKTWTPYYMVPDQNTYSTYSQVYDLYTFKAIDPTDQLMDLSLQTQHGVVSDPSTDGIHRPVEFTNIGKVKKVIDTGSMTRGWIGVETYDLNATAIGALVNDVYPNSPADLAGIEVGDVILSVDGTTIKSTIDLLYLIENAKPMSMVIVTILRGIQTHPLEVVIGDQLSNLEYYQFVLNEVPKRGTYIELKVEQSGGLNPRVHATIDDSVVITVLEDGNNFMYTEVYDSRNPNNPIITINDADPIDNGDPSQYVDMEYWDRDYVD